MGGRPRADVDTTKLYETLGVSQGAARMSLFLKPTYLSKYHVNPTSQSHRSKRVPMKKK